MNRLQLAQKLLLEAGIAGDISSTSGNVGELARVVNWIDLAYMDICDKRQDWNFLRNDFTFNCTPATSVYPKSTIQDLANWKKDSLRCYLTNLYDEQWLKYVPWDIFRDTRLKGASRTITGRPIQFSIKPDKSLVLFPIPDAAYTIDGECFHQAYVMINDTDTPIFSRFQMAIVYNALMRAAAWLSDPAMYTYAQKEYGRLINKLDADNTPVIYAGNALV